MYTEADIPESIEDIRSLIETLPKEVVSEKTINGTVRYYHQWYEGSEQHTRYITAEDYSGLREGAEFRRLLQRRLRELDGTAQGNRPFELDVTTGEGLRDMADKVKGFGRRECYMDLDRYLRSGDREVCILYGLRLTGKTTLMLQAVSAMSDEDQSRSAYIRVEPGDTMPQIRRDLRTLHESGFKYVFVGEATRLRDFIGSSRFFSRFVETTGMRVVLTGTDSLGFWFAEGDVLYGKTTIIRTTHIPFREHSRLLSVDDVDDYIRHGGVLGSGEIFTYEPSGTSGDPVFSDGSTAGGYIGTAIVGNIRDSLKNFNWGGNLRSLFDLYGKGLLADAVGRVVGDMNRRPLIPYLLEDYVSANLEEMSRIPAYIGDRGAPDLLLSYFEEDLLLQRLERTLKTMSKKDGTTELTDANVIEIRQYLEAVGAFVPIPAETCCENADVPRRSLCVQPGMRFCQCRELISAMEADGNYLRIPADRRRDIRERIEKTLFDHLLEEIVLCDTIESLDRGYRAFKLFLPAGDIDMVVCDGESGTCVLFEVGHDPVQAPAQRLRLLDKEMSKQIEDRFGGIAGRYILHRGGDSDRGDGVVYLNVERFLRGLPESVQNLM